MQLILLRHGDKKRSLHDPDVDLSDMGRLQADRLVHLVKAAEMLTPSAIYCSPKKRAIQTVSPLAEHLKIRAHVAYDLDEHRDREQRDDFVRRVRMAIDAFSQKSGPILACSHVDWLRQAVLAMFGPIDDEFQCHFAMGQLRVFEFDGVIWHSDHPYEHKI